MVFFTRKLYDDGLFVKNETDQIQQVPTEAANTCDQLLKHDSVRASVRVYARHRDAAGERG